MEDMALEGTMVAEIADVVEANVACNNRVIRRQMVDALILFKRFSI